MSTFWVTFYSYKGGVGRTMALANVAALLAKAGRKVLLIDFDLEAPGLDAFGEFGCVKAHPGVVEYVAAYLATGKSPGVRDYVHECTAASTHLRGRLWLMPSGKKDQQYNRDRARINWADLYDKYDGERFIDNWKCDVEKTYAPDYVLIDSRTGLTDVAGICTLHFPQLVVLLYALNDQNIDGIAGVARAISRVENSRPPQLLTVATPVPPMPKERTGLLQERLDYAAKQLGIQPHRQIHYDGRVPLKEQILVWDDASSRLAVEYADLKEAISDYDIRGFDFLLKQLRAAANELDTERADGAARDLQKDYADRAESFYHIANASRALGRPDQIESNLRLALKLDAYFSPAYEELIAFLRTQKRPQDAAAVCQERLIGLNAEFSTEEISSTLWDLGEMSMAVGDYNTAVTAYQRLSKSPASEASNELRLAYIFNRTEARRRAGEKISGTEWKQLIRVFESGAAIESASSISMRLNHLQAMHIPYALVGEIDRVRQLFMQIRDLATSVSPRERLFSVAAYVHLPAADWFRETASMADAVERGTLWDGTPLPTTAVGE